MAIMSPLQGTGGISDGTINAMLQSGDPNLISQANEYISSKEQQAEELGTNQGILGTLSDLFGFSTLAAAEPNQPVGQRNSLQFSVTQPSQFTFKPTPIVPGNIDMAGSVFKNYPYLDTKGILQNLQPTRVEDDDYENIDKFLEEPDYRNIFHRGMDFYRESPGTRLGIGALLGGPVGALASFFAPKVFDSVSEGIGNIFGPRVDMAKVQQGIESARDDDSQEGVSSFDSAVSAGIQAAEDDI